jgi:mutator protein MutT
MSNIDRPVFRLAVFVIIRDSEGKILLQQRAGTEFLPGYYDFPSGHVESDESFTQAAVRELAEEVSLSCQESDLHLVHLSQNYVDEPYVNIVFEAAKWEGTPTIGEPEKCSDLQFCSPNGLPEKCTLAVRLLQQQSFQKDLTTRYIDAEAYVQLMGEQFVLSDI